MNSNKAVFTTTLGEKETMDKVARHCPNPKMWQAYREEYKKTLACNLDTITQYPIQIDFELNGTCNYLCDSCTHRLEIDSGGRYLKKNFKKL